MPVKVKRSGAWVDALNGQIQGKVGGVWKSPRRAYVKRGGVWVDSQYLGKSNPPGTPFITGWDTNYFSIASVVPTGGVPYAQIRFQILNEFGGFLTEIVASVSEPFASALYGTAYEDTKYIIRAYALTAEGTYSNPSADLRVWIGHSQLGYSQTDYGWGGYTTVRPAQIDGTSEAVANAGYLAVDPDGVSTAYVSAGRAGRLGDGWWEGLWLANSIGGNRWLTKVFVSCQFEEIVWLGIEYNGGWIGGVSAATVGINAAALPGGNYDPLLNHNYLAGDNGGLTTRTFDLEAYGLIFLNLSKYTIAVTNLVPYPGNGPYRAEIQDVVIEYRDWVPVGSHFVVTRTAQDNQYW